MRLRAAIALLSVTLCRAAAVNQQPTVEITPEKAAQQQTDDQGPDPRDNRKKTLTPEEEMQEQIRLFDPLDRGSQERNTPGNDPRNHQGPAAGGARNSGATGNQPRYANSAGADSGSTVNGYDGPAVSDDKPLAGSLAASRLQEQSSPGGPRVSENSGNSGGEYTGPAVLSRSYTIGTLSGPRDTKWNQMLGFTEIYDTGTNKPVANATGAVPSAASTGMQFSWGFGGQRKMHSDLVNFSYTGNISRYSRNGTSNGSNHTATVSWTHIISRHLTLSFVNNASFLSSNFALDNPTLAAGPSIANLNVASSSNVEPNNSSTSQINSQLGVSWQQSARLSFTASTSYFGISRSGAGMVGAVGRQAQGGANYRYSRQMTLGLYYSNGHNQYPHGLGGSDTNTFGMNVARTIGRSMQIRMRAGLSQTETIVQTPVFVAPIVAALLGTRVGIIDAYARRSSGDLSGEFRKDFGRRRTAFLAYTRGIAPGNGLLLTSQQTLITAGMTSKLLRRYTLQVSGSSESLTSIAQTATRDYTSKGAQVAISRPWKSGLTLATTLGYRYYGSATPGLLPNEFRFSSGVTWSPTGGRLLPF